MGNAYITGSALSPNATSNSSDAIDAFVAKLNPQGTAFEYVTYFGGSGADTAKGISVNGGRVNVTNPAR